MHNNFENNNPISSSESLKNTEINRNKDVKYTVSQEVSTVSAEHLEWFSENTKEKLQKFKDNPQKRAITYSEVFSNLWYKKYKLQDLRQQYEFFIIEEIVDKLANGIKKQFVEWWGDHEFIMWVNIKWDSSPKTAGFDPYIYEETWRKVKRTNEEYALLRAMAVKEYFLEVLQEKWIPQTIIDLIEEDIVVDSYVHPNVPDWKKDEDLPWVHFKVLSIITKQEVNEVTQILASG